ncbi:DUF1326 domain-containing protein [Streptomyces sp. NPDC004520]|uniref:DUF1326 domain-containing protein n=1 Tax=Streptomyces sp. NPDC004520 TaxID=3364702 RepID=UPI0036BA7F48
MHGSRRGPRRRGEARSGASIPRHPSLVSLIVRPGPWPIGPTHRRSVGRRPLCRSQYAHRGPAHVGRRSPAQVTDGPRHRTSPDQVEGDCVAGGGRADKLVDLAGAAQPVGRAVLAERGGDLRVAAAGGERRQGGPGGRPAEDRAPSSARAAVTAQRAALEDIFRGNAGGWPGKFGSLVSDVRDVRYASMEFEAAHDLRYRRAAISGKVDVGATALTGPTANPKRRVQLVDAPGRRWDPARWRHGASFGTTAPKGSPSPASTTVDRAGTSPSHGGARHRFLIRRCSLHVVRRSTVDGPVAAPPFPRGRVSRPRMRDFSRVRRLGLRRHRHR